MANCRVCQETGCWLWTGQLSTTWGRYPQLNIRVEGKVAKKRAHRVICELILGRAIDSYNETVEHICKVRQCIRPDHLGLMEMLDNACRAPGKPMVLVVPEGRYWHPSEAIPF